MKELDTLKTIKSPAFDAFQQLQKSSAFSAALKLETTGAFAAARELQSTLSAMKTSMVGANTALEEYSKIIAPISESIKTLNLSYAPIFEQTKAFDTLNIKGIISGLQTSSVAMSALSELNLSGIASIIDSLPKYDFLSDMISGDFSVDDVGKLYKDGEITQEEINEEIAEIVNQKQFLPQAEWDKIKKSKWFIAIKILFFIVCFICEPVVDDIKEKTRDTLGITEFWGDSGIYELIDTLFSDTDETTVSETEAKATVDKNKIGNISKRKRDDLLDKIKEIRTFISATSQDENTGNLLSYLSELEKDVCGKKYGLMFEEHREEIDEVLATHTPVLTEQSDLFISNGGEVNYLIEGDNLASLQLLEKTHKGCIQMIYIDPPYNTGNKDFTYDDSKVGGLDGFRHSKWLSFMDARLKVAKKLLSSQGVIFVSIDDNEMATLKSLCDNIFGEQNFIANVVVKSNPRGSQSTKEIASVHEYILVYAKDINSAAIIGHKLTDNMLSEYNLSDEKGAYRLLGLRQRGGFWRASERPKLFYPFYVNPEDATISLDEDEKHTVSVYPYQPTTGEKGTWRWSKDKVEKDGENLMAKRVKRGGDVVWDIYQKDYVSTGDIVRRTKAKSLWDEKEMNYQNAANELKSLFGVSPFTYAKPTYLVQRVMEMIDFSENPYVLDFFAGSGTTGHAVMKLNKEDGGNRKFILCTNNENNICRDITYERIKRVIDKEEYVASLKYYNVDYIPISERMYYEYADELLAHTRELVELENGIDFANNTEIGIVLTEEELDDFINSLNNNSSFNKVYLGHDILLDAYQAYILKEKNVTVNIIPDYYYRELEG